MARSPATADARPSAPDRDPVSWAQFELSDRRLETLSYSHLQDQVSAELLRTSDSNYGELQRSVSIRAGESGASGFGSKCRGLALVLSAGLEDAKERMRNLAGQTPDRARMATAFCCGSSPEASFPSVKSGRSGA
jgi:hypothetical protein